MGDAVETLADEEDDEDYAPDCDDDAENDDDDDAGPEGYAPEEGLEVTNDDGPSLSITKRRAVDDAFSDLFGSSSSSSSSVRARTTRRGGGRRDDKALDGDGGRNREILAGMLGRAAAAGVVSRVTALTAARREQRASAGASAGASAEESVRQPKRQRTVIETKRFAGKMVQVERMATENDSGGGPAVVDPAAAVVPTAGAPAKGIDALLSEISRPDRLSTLAKTSSDWDVFKNRTDMAGELEAGAEGKDAYLVKKDFLDRVDHRKFELEKTERARKRASEGR